MLEIYFIKGKLFMLHVLKLKVLDPLCMLQLAELRSSSADWGARLTQAERRNLRVKDCRKGGRIHLLSYTADHTQKYKDCQKPVCLQSSHARLGRKGIEKDVVLVIIIKYFQLFC